MIIRKTKTAPVNKQASSMWKKTSHGNFSAARNLGEIVDVKRAGVWNRTKRKQ